MQTCAVLRMRGERVGHGLGQKIMRQTDGSPSPPFGCEIPLASDEGIFVGVERGAGRVPRCGVQLSQHPWMQQRHVR